MHLVIHCNEYQKNIIESKVFVGEHFISWSNMPLENADVFFDFLFEDEGAAFATIKHKPVFVNAVITTTEGLPENFIRINGWNGFIEKNSVEIATNANAKPAVSVLQQLKWLHIIAPDTVGMISPRVIAMIINEAYFAWEDKVSSKEEIDIAMKLGTNYPYGPFEWSKKIGLKKVYALLVELCKQDNRYTPCKTLKAEAQLIN